jgi:hypothetical protein
VGGFETLPYGVVGLTPASGWMYDVNDAALYLYVLRRYEEVLVVAVFGFKA